MAKGGALLRRWVQKAHVGSNPTSSAEFWTGGRAAEGARLESVLTLKVSRGFESHPVRFLETVRDGRWDSHRCFCSVAAKGSRR